ncbi:DegV family protein [Vermiculatibacterium agrestimuris]|uniref:DegV family protein n=1 Tax=Vermiculatibacterium agrestimuris TaxID=2941519 RepID=UPI00204142FA|nr:DegV family protein [Vermiculatibacterium agrestimuris]
MSEYVIVTDSSADLTQELVEELELSVLPLSFTIRGTTLEDHPDKRNMSSKEFYQLLRDGEMSTTSAVNMQQYIDLLEPVLTEGKDVLILSFTSGLSNTCQASMMAASELREKFPERKIEVVDTLCASAGQGLLVWCAGKKRLAGESLEAVRDWCEENKMKVCHWVTVNDLMHLKRGGRISATTALAGTLLQIKPIIHVDDAGKLDTVDKARGRKAALDYLVKKVQDTAIDPQEQTVFLSHSDCQEDIEYVAAQLREKVGVKDVKICDIGPVIGSHTGPGCAVVFFFGQPR